MIDVARLAGARPSVLLRLALDGITRHRSRSIVTALVVGLAVAAVVGTTGRTVAARMNVLARLEDPSARLIRIVDRTGQAGLSPGVVTRIAGLRSVEWVVGLSPAGPLGRNPAIGRPVEGFGRDAVGTRLYWGQLEGSPLVHLVAGRPPRIGEAAAGSDAASALGLADRVGPVIDEQRGTLPVVETVAVEPAVTSLGHYVLIRGAPGEGPVGEIIVLARTGDDVEPLVAQLPGVLAPGDGRAIGIERAQELLSLRNALAREVGDLNAAILIGSLTASALLIAAILYGAISERRREFGLRRSQGATRSDIGVLVVTETALLATIGAVAGAALGELLVLGQAGTLPDPILGGAIVILVTLAALAGSLPAAVSAALGEPLYVLRSG